MNNEQVIKAALAYKGISQSCIATSIGTTTSNFNQKLKKDTLSREELEKIADVLGAAYKHWYFEFPDGTVIGGAVSVPKATKGKK